MIEQSMSQQHKRLKIILIGDKCIDEYHYGTIDRLSPEAPVPVFVPKRSEQYNGMAANVYENLLNLNVEIVPYFGNTSTKIRMIDDRSKQHVLRIDNDIKSEPLDYNSANFVLDDIDGIIISDYNKGYVTYELIESLIKTKIPVFIDTKKTDLIRFNGAFVKINSTEFALAKSLPDNLIVTMGKDGAKWNDKVYPAPQLEITDVCGAGDTFLSAFSYKYLMTANMDTSIEFAIKAASITVQHFGVYAPTLDEIL